MANKEFLGVTVDPEVLGRIERERGQIKRATYVNNLLRQALKMGVGGDD